MDVNIQVLRNMVEYFWTMACRQDGCDPKNRTAYFYPTNSYGKAYHAALLTLWDKERKLK